MRICGRYACIQRIRHQGSDRECSLAEWTKNLTDTFMMLRQSAFEYGQFSMIDVQELDGSTISLHVEISVYRYHVTGLFRLAEYEGGDQLTAIAISRT
jgi:hypothetical protein